MKLVDKEQLLKLRQDGLTRVEIANYFGVTSKVIDNTVKFYNLPKLRNKELDPVLLKQYFDNGISICDIAKLFNVGKDVVIKNIKSLNLKRSQDKINENRKKTIEKKYGENMDDFYKSNHEKSLNTMKKRTGLENPYKDENLLKKRRQTNLKKYGYDNPTKSDEVKEKIKKTNNVRYGGNAPTCSDEIKEKISASYFEKTGYTNPSKNPEVQKKKIKTFEDRYGVPNSSQKNFSDIAKNILLNKENFYNYLISDSFISIEKMAADLGVSKSTIWKTIRRFDLIESVPKFISRGEEELRSFVQSLDNSAHKVVGLLGDKREIDVYCESSHIGFEYDGVYYHSDIFQPSRLYHYNKSKECEKNGIRLIHIYEDEWYDPVKRKIIESLIKISLGKVENRIYARDCEIRKISNAEARPFNNENHIQGHRNAKITYGLFYEEKLVQLMSFSWNNHYKAWEIIRGCPGSNNIVVGGVSKLFKHFIKENNPDKIFSYCDYNKFNGVGYEAIGMKFIGETKYNKWYVINGKRYERNPKKYKTYKKIADCILWGAGSKKYLWENPNKVISE